VSRRKPGLAQLRRICLALPEAKEKTFGGHTTPTFRVRDKIFASYETIDRRPALTCKAPPGAQAVLVGADSERYFVPPYVGHNGWVGVRLDGQVDWAFIAELVTESYRMTAPKRIAAPLP
jgi:predicted DNA-binding protein (MmcQ/YjbR family)